MEGPLHDITPIMVSLVRKDGINALLDDMTDHAERNLEGAKSTLYPLMSSKGVVDDDFIRKVDARHFNAILTPL